MPPDDTDAPGGVPTPISSGRSSKASKSPESKSERTRSTPSQPVVQLQLRTPQQPQLTLTSASLGKPPSQRALQRTPVQTRKPLGTPGVAGATGTPDPSALSDRPRDTGTFEIRRVDTTPRSRQPSGLPSAGQTPVLPVQRRMSHRHSLRSPTAASFPRQHGPSLTPPPGRSEDPAWRPWAGVVSRLLRYNDSADERLRKEVTIPAAIATAFVALLSAAIHASASAWLAAGADFLVAVAAVAPAGVAWWTRKLPQTTVDTACIVCCVLFCVGDLLTLGGGDVWIFSFLSLCGVQLLGSREARPTAALFGVVAMWLCVRLVGDAADADIYDGIPYTAGLARGWRPPMGWELGIAAFVRRAVTWLLLCVCVQWRSTVLKRQRQRSDAAARLTEDIAEALVRFDLDDAEALFDTAQAHGKRSHYCEDRMLAAFRELLANLRIYRPYLPDALFVVDAASLGDDMSLDGGAWSPRPVGMPRSPLGLLGAERPPLPADAPPVSIRQSAQQLAEQGVELHAVTNFENPMSPGLGPGQPLVGSKPAPEAQPASRQASSDPPRASKRPPPLRNPLDVGIGGAPGQPEMEPRRRGPQAQRGLRPRRGSLLRAELAIDALPVASGHREQADHIATRFASAVLNNGKRAQGVALTLSVDHILVAWNTHAPVASHAHNAALCALAVSLDLSCAAEQIPRWAVALATGPVLAGTSGTDEHLAAVVAGHPVRVVACVAQLSERVQAPCLADDHTYEQVRGEVVGRVVDAVRMPAPLGEGSEQPPRDVLVYELAQRKQHGVNDSPGISPTHSDDGVLPNQPIIPGSGLNCASQSWLVAKEHMLDSEASQRYATAFSALRQMKFAQVKTLLSHHLKIYPCDYQAQRLLRIALLLKKKKLPQDLRDMTSDNDCYVRRFVGWFDFETRSEGLRLPKEVRQAAAAARGDEIQSEPGSPGALSRASSCFDQSPRAGRGRSRNFSLASASEPGSPQEQIVSGLSAFASDADEAALRRAIEDARKKGPEAPKDGELAGTVPRSFTDSRGRLWHRANKALGKGAFGEVFLGMGQDGAFVALKSVQLPKSLRAQRLSFSIQEGNLEGGGCMFPFMAPPTKVATVATEGAQATIDHLLREVSLMATLIHENVVTYLGSALCSEYIVVTMEYVPGGSLHGVLTQFDGKLPMCSVQRYMRDVLRGLVFLHGRGVVHRDMKPHNVLVTAEGTGKLADFGASADLHALAAADNKEVTGTPQYMAPEACRGDACSASDVWGVGILLAELLTGELPWELPQPFRPNAFITQLAEDKDLNPRFGALTEWPLARAFCEECCRRDHAMRPSANGLQHHAFILA